MPKVRVFNHPLGVLVRSDLPERDKNILGDASELVLPGEECWGLSYNDLVRIANTTHIVDLPE